MRDEGKKCLKTFPKVPERQNLPNQTICELHTNDNKSKYASNPKDIFKSPRKVYETLYTKKTTPEAATNEFLTKVPNSKTVSNEQFTFVGENIFR